ncbi:hypothetical protein TGGT1_409050 [Toxoplasma gondii GT1]|uniref:Uncharacterized protein n=1 Tax=Toxoplasma gondii (strain ATCC 50853 / GT1) TaxID=507601 RepID=S7UXX3_TOXGG|nr:hypothetical protein TGGT1_409050 [Toxoplasma gondii GT1]
MGVNTSYWRLSSCDAGVFTPLLSPLLYRFHAQPEDVGCERSDVDSKVGIGSWKNRAPALQCRVTDLKHDTTSLRQTRVSHRAFGVKVDVV